MTIISCYGDTFAVSEYGHGGYEASEMGYEVPNM
jgi:hypothetical protein